MPRIKKLKFDRIGYWSEIKLDILKDYAKAYSTIFSAEKQRRFHHVYIDAFAGAGVNISRQTGKFVKGSPLNALSVEPQFREFFFVDLGGRKVDLLRELVGKRVGIHIYRGDCNSILLQQVFPNVRYEDYRRGLCLLDPYGLHLNWEVIQTAGHMKSIDMFLNFPIMDANRNVLWENPDRIDKGALARMNAFWGDESWRESVYELVPTLFGSQSEKTADANKVIAETFRRRLKDVGGFGRVSEPLPMRNTRGAVVYYLFFASQRPVADDIVSGIFHKYRFRQG